MLTRLKLAEHDAAAEALSAFIAEGDYAPGDRLPPERELMERLGLSRTNLRKALDTFERDGLIWRHVGKGTFLASQEPDGVGGDLQELCRELSPVKMMRARVCIEAAIAREAAINASNGAIQNLKETKDRARKAASWAEYEHHDGLFHCAVAEATDNPLLLTLFVQLNLVRRAVAVSNVVRGSDRPSEDHKSFAEHERIVAAIEARDPAEAYDAMRAHLGSVSARLFEEA